MDLLTPEMMDKLVGLLATVSEDATTAVIVYFLLPLFLLIVQAIGCVVVVSYLYKASIKISNDYFSRPPAPIQKVEKVEVVRIESDKYQSSFAYCLRESLTKLITLTRTYQRPNSDYVHTSDVALLIADAERGKALRLANED